MWNKVLTAEIHLKLVFLCVFLFFVDTLAFKQIGFGSFQGLSFQPTNER